MRRVMAFIIGVIVLGAASAASAQCVVEARNLRLQQRFSEAEKTAQACIEGNPENVGASLELVRALAAQGQQAEALARVVEALEGHPDDVHLLSMHARLLAWQGNNEDARKIMQKLPSRLYTEPWAIELRGDILLWGEDYEEAVTWYDRYISRRPDDPIVLYKRGLARQRMGDSEDARVDLKKSCDIAPKATKACAVLETAASQVYPKIFANVHYGYSRVVQRLDGWSLRGAVGSELNKNLTMMGTWEWLHRPFFDHRQTDLRLRADTSYQFDGGLRMRQGGGLTPDATFSPEWNAYVEPGWKFEKFSAGLRLWHIQFPDETVEALNPNVELYFKPWMIELRYFATFDAEGLGHSAFARAFYFFSDLTQLYVGGGLGDRSDFLELRDVGAQSHWLVTTGFRYHFWNNHRVMISVIQRTDQAEFETYDQMETLVGYEFRL